MIDPNLLYRSVVLNVAHNRAVQNLVETRCWSFASRFVAGKTVEEALGAVDALEKDGVHAILDLLGEMITTEEEVRTFSSNVRGLVKAFGARPYPRYVSVKLTQLGLDLDVDKTLALTKEIATLARDNDCFLRIDMEDHPRVDKTLQIFRALREDGFENVGLVLQAYLFRVEKDLRDLLDLKPNLRIVKGAYKEPADVAFQEMAAVDDNYIKLVQLNLKAGNQTAVATHDERIIDSVKQWVVDEKIDPSLVEYQLLYGIRRDLQRSLADEGHRVRAYVPFGNQWYPYFSRRIAERPENMLFVMKAVLQG